LIFILSVYHYEFYWQAHKQQYSIKKNFCKWFMICDLLMSPSVIILPTDLWWQKCTKKIYPLYSVDIYIDEYNISPIKKTYVISLMIFFVRRYSPWWILTYNHQRDRLYFCHSGSDICTNSFSNLLNIPMD
jgi:hypothetical protein